MDALAYDGFSQTNLHSDLRESIRSPAFNNLSHPPETLPRPLREVGTGLGLMVSSVLARRGTCDGGVLKRGPALVDQLYAIPVGLVGR